MHRIGLLKAGYANAFAIAGDSLLLVDSGPESAATAAIEGAARFFRECGLDGPPALVLLTHAHVDHYGGVPAALARWPGTPVLCGEADALAMAEGRNADLVPLGLKGKLVSLLPHGPGPGSGPRADRLVPADAGPIPLPEDPGVLVVPVPGHTRGSLAFVVDDVAIVGDLVMGGMLFGSWPGWPFYGIRDEIRESLRTLRRLGVREILTGHGGPFDADAVWRKFGVS